MAENEFLVGQEYESPEPGRHSSASGSQRPPQESASILRGDGDLSPVSILSLCGGVAQSAMFVTEVLWATQMTPGTVRLDITHSVPPSLLPLFPFLSL